MTEENAPKYKILLLDDDPRVLEVYQQMLLQLPSQPEVHIASSGARAMAMLDSDVFNVLVCDLNMPKMDGLQVVAIVRRKYPQLRTVIITGLNDEQMRARAYAIGVDLYLTKPTGENEFGFLLDCVESLLDKEQTAGFRGVQSKTLVDLIQLECLSGSPSVLKITQSKIDAKIWIRDGELVDAETQDARGEEAFKHILSWKTGSFEILPSEPERPRTIHSSYQALLLESAQALDEGKDFSETPEGIAGQKEADTQFFTKGALGRVPGVEFALKLQKDRTEPMEKWGLEDPKPISEWACGTVSGFQELAEKLQWGGFQEFAGKSLQSHTRIVTDGAATFVVGMLPSLGKAEVEGTVRKVVARWAS